MTHTQRSSHQRLHHLTIDGVGLAVAVIQDAAAPAATVAWLHGLGGAATVAFAPLARHPSLAGVRSLLIDLPGHGRSSRPADWSYAIEDQAELVAEAIRRMADGPVTMFGHSMGGSIAILAAAPLQQTLSRLILAEPNLDERGGPTSGLIAGQAEEAFVQQGFMRMLRATRLEARRGNRALAQWAETLEMADPLALHRSATSLLARREPTFGDIFTRMEIPRAIIMGDHAGSRPAVPGVPMHVVANASHLLMADNPEGFMASLVAALALPVAPRFC
jgi:pimeloyl-ACP methyl ester carboxylesterase